MNSPRERLVATAADLFYRRGCHATGIDTVLAAAGVAKMTLYKHFGSKDELVAAAVRHLDERFRARFSAAGAAAAPGERLLCLFDAVAQWVDGGAFFGCPFVNLSAEFPELDNPVHAAAADNKRAMFALMCELAHDEGARDAAALARQIQILLEGCVVLCQVTGSRAAIGAAREAAAILVAAAAAPR